MSVSIPVGLTVQQYIGQPFAAPVLNCGPSPAGRPPVAVPISIDWSAYRVGAQATATTLAVNLDLNGFTSAGTVIDRVQSVKIDNANSFSPILLLFDDGETVVCPPNTIITAPVISTVTKLTIIAQNVQSGFVPLNKFWFYNFPVQPFVDPVIQAVYPQYLGSPLIQRGNLLTPGFGAPALGDQTSFTSFNLTGIGEQLGVWQAPRTGFIYVTGLQVSVSECVGSTFMDCQLAIVAGASILYLWSFGVAGNQQVTNPQGWSYQELFSQTGMNVRLDATLPWVFIHLVGTLLSGNARLITHYTLSET